MSVDPSQDGTPRPRRVAESQITMSQVMFPGDANPTGNVHGGVIMKLVDQAAGVCATRHIRGRTVTARIDSMSFLQPVYVGDLVTLKASVNDVGRTSLEVGVRVETENLITGEVRHVSSAYLVFVALDETGHPSPVPPLIAETDEERRRMAGAKLRREHRQRGEAAVRAIRHTADPRGDLAQWRQLGRSVVVVGHRGAAGLAPENTIPSFELAVSQGVDAVETDVHLSADGVPVCIHDETVDRTTDGKGAVAGFTVAELRQLDARGRFRESYAEARIPTLDEVARWARGRTRLVVELKGTDNPKLVPRTIDVLRQHDLLAKTLLISFDHLALQQARAAEPSALTGALYVARSANPVGIASSCGADVLCPQWSSATLETVEAAHHAGLAVSVWTANDRVAIETSIANGVDAITTDYPARVSAVARERR